MDNYHEADWCLRKINYSKIPVTSSDEKQYENGIKHKDNSITASKKISIELFLMLNCFVDCFNCYRILRSAR